MLTNEKNKNTLIMISFLLFALLSVSMYEEEM
jgi:hypothetical protein